MNEHVLFPAGYDETWMRGYLAARPLDGDDEGLWLVVKPLLLNRARLCVCEPGYSGDASIEHWCMDSPIDALIAWGSWPLPPIHWNRHQRRDRTHEYQPVRPIRVETE